MLQKTITLDVLCRELESARAKRGASKKRFMDLFPGLVLKHASKKREGGMRVIL